MTPQERQVWRITFANAWASGKPNAIQIADRAIIFLRNLDPSVSQMANIAMNLGNARNAKVG